MPKCARLVRCIHNFTCHACSKVDPPSEMPRADWWGRAAFMAVQTARKLAQLCYFWGDTQEVHWSIQGFMEEIKISLAKFLFFWDIVLRNYVYTTTFVSQFLSDQLWLVEKK